MQTYSEDIIKILPKGLVTIPKKMRLNVGFEENSLVRIKQEKGKVILEPIRVLSYPVRTYTKNEVKQFIRLDEEETKKLKNKSII